MNLFENRLLFGKWFISPIQVRRRKVKVSNVQIDRARGLPCLCKTYIAEYEKTLEWDRKLLLIDPVDRQICGQISEDHAY